MVADTEQDISVVFIDIVGMGQLYHKVDEADAEARMIEWRNEIVAQVEGSAGQIIQQLGYELLCAFPNPQNAFEAAHNLQRMAADRNSTNSGNQYLGVKVGIHHGRVAFHENAISGEAMYIAKRMINHANANQVITTRYTRDMVVTSDRLKFQAPDRNGYDTRDDQLTLQELRWQDISEDKPYIELSLGDQCIKVSEDDGTVTVGRNTSNTLCIPVPGVSREHLFITFHNGWMELRDASKNGTQIVPVGDKPSLLKKRKARIKCSGTLRLCPTGKDADQTVLSYTITHHLSQPLDGIA
jgi:adenylate cyclase